MDLEAVKVKLLGSSEKQFGFLPSEDGKGNKDPNWMRMWDEEKRESYNIPTDVFNHIKANPTIDTLGVRVKEMEAKSGKPYTHYTIYKYNEAEFTL